MGKRHFYFAMVKRENGRDTDDDAPRVDPLSPELTLFRRTLLHLDLLLAPPPIGLGYKNLTTPTHGTIIIKWATQTAKLCETTTQALKLMQNMERIGGLRVLRGVGEDADYVHAGAIQIRNFGIYNQYLTDGITKFCKVQKEWDNYEDDWNINGSTDVCNCGTARHMERNIVIYDEDPYFYQHIEDVHWAPIRIIKGIEICWTNLVQYCTSRDGHEVDYSKVRECPYWPLMLECLHRFGEIPQKNIESLREGWDDDDPIWKGLMLNLYNILVWHGKIVAGHPHSITSRSRFFDHVKYHFAGEHGPTVSLSQLEHQILRRKWANESDLRGKLVVKKKDPRMHFVLNCGAQSCPPIVPIQYESVSRQMDECTRNFVAKNCEIDLDHNTVTLSRLFKWFQTDFTPQGRDTLSLLRWIKHYAESKMAKKIDLLCNTIMSGEKVELKFQRYNWQDNGDWTAPPDDHWMHVYDLSFKRAE